MPFLAFTSPRSSVSSSVTNRRGLANLPAYRKRALALGGCTQPIKPPPPEALAGSPVPFEQLPPAERGDVVDIIFATDRKPEVDAYERATFGASRSTILRATRSSPGHRRRQSN